MHKPLADVKEIRAKLITGSKAKIKLDFDVLRASPEQRREWNAVQTDETHKLTEDTSIIHFSASLHSTGTATILALDHGVIVDRWTIDRDNDLNTVMCGDSIRVLQGSGAGVLEFAVVQR